MNVSGNYSLMHDFNILFSIYIISYQVLVCICVSIDSVYIQQKPLLYACVFGIYVYLMWFQAAPGGTGLIIQLETAAGAAMKNFNGGIGKQNANILYDRYVYISASVHHRYKGASIKIFAS